MAEEFMEWKSIPIRSREAMDTIFRYGYALAYKESHVPFMKNQWSCFAIGEDGKAEYCCKYGEQTIGILIRLFLLETLQPDVDVFAGAGLRGLATWKKAMIDGHIRISPMTSVWGSKNFENLDQSIDQMLENAD